MSSGIIHAGPAGDPRNNSHLEAAERFRYADPAKIRDAEIQHAAIIQACPWLRPRVHGNGFVQLDLVPDGSRRLHIWGHPDIPRQAVTSSIHDHVYSVHSTLLVGRLINILWRIDGKSEPSHTVYTAEPRSGSDTQLVASGHRVRVSTSAVFACGEGCPNPEYIVKVGDFHSTIPDGLAVTLMTKIVPPFARGKPRVLVPLGERPDNTFNRHAHSPALLWRIISEVYPAWHVLLRS